MFTGYLTLTLYLCQNATRTMAQCDVSTNTTTRTAQDSFPERDLE